MELPGVATAYKEHLVVVVHQWMGTREVGEVDKEVDEPSRFIVVEEAGERAGVDVEVVDASEVEEEDVVERDGELVRVA